MSKARARAAKDDLEIGDGWLEEFMPYRLYRVVNRLNLRLQNRLKAIGISPSQWRVLSVLRSHGTLTIGKIVEHTLMEQSTVSRVIDQLENDGRATRRTSAADSRMIEVVLTETGVDAFEKILPAARRHERIAMEGFSAREIATLRAFLARLEDNITQDDY
ncbi:MarR family winged helix-turn-helix transcriptional regulator [Sphingomonas flavalba]|uniref:MarR family winged helix-turn-helix transcriptional regulator n=1 Tax=Sphingomonas flavalba TaxID=2559804 RepID=UPI0039E0B205